MSDLQQSVFWQLLWLMIPFGFVLILAYAGSRLLASRVQNLGRKHTAEIVESISLGGRKYLCRVRIDDRLMTLGVTDHNISLLDIRLDEPPAPGTQGEKPIGMSAAEGLRHWLGRWADTVRSRGSGDGEGR